MVITIAIRYIVCLSHLRTDWPVLEALRNVMLRSNTREEIQEETQDVEGECKRHNPFEDGSNIVRLGKVGRRENDCEHDFHKDEDKFCPE